MLKRRVYKEGEKIGECVFLRETPTDPYVPRVATFLCHCGKEFTANIRSAVRLEVKQCKQCVIEIRTKKLIKISTSHGKSQTKEYRCYAEIKKRCKPGSEARFPDYSGRGIRVCQRWLESFDNFLADMGAKPTEKYSIERVDVNGNYEPSNCIWLLNTLQAQNTRKSRYLTYKGETKLLKFWADEVGLKARTLHSRVFRQGMSVQEAIETPLTETVGKNKGKPKQYPVIRHAFGYIG